MLEFGQRVMVEEIDTSFGESTTRTKITEGVVLEPQTDKVGNVDDEGEFVFVALKGGRTRVVHRSYVRERSDDVKVTVMATESEAAAETLATASDRFTGSVTLNEWQPGAEGRENVLPTGSDVASARALQSIAGSLLVTCHLLERCCRGIEAMAKIADGKWGE